MKNVFKLLVIINRKGKMNFKNMKLWFSILIKLMKIKNYF